MRKLLVFFIILAVLVVGADFVGRYVAESKAGEAIATQTDLKPAPSVDIHGFSFLFQALRGRYDHITILSSGLTAGTLTNIDAGAELYDITMPLSDAIGGNIDNLVAGSADLTVRIPADSLKTVLGLAELTVEPGETNTVRLGTTLAVAGRAFDVKMDVKAAVTDGTLHLQGGKLIGAPAGIPAALTTEATKNLTTEIPLTGLPIDLTTATVAVDGNTVVITGATRNVKIGKLVNSSR